MCPSRPLCYYSCNVWPSGSRFHGQHMAVWIFRFHGCSRSLFRHEPYSWCSQRVSSIRQCFALGTGSAQKVLLPPLHRTFFFSSNQCCNITLYYSDRVHIFFQISNTNQSEIRKRKCALYFSIIETRVQKYSRLRYLLLVKGLVIFFFFRAGLAVLFKSETIQFR